VGNQLFDQGYRALLNTTSRQPLKMGDAILVAGLAVRLRYQFQLRAQSEFEWSVPLSGLGCVPVVNISIIAVLQGVPTYTPS
jgi:hypothetical protein